MQSTHRNRYIGHEHHQAKKRGKDSHILKNNKAYRIVNAYKHKAH